ncbi:MAG: Clp protease N-terminal domain-containing protein, partial [bacterium]|nr:Clp protease N-terminal domain-containing protein [bacterium]
MFDNFTRGAKNSLANAEKEARAFLHDYIGSEHILLGLLYEEEEVSARVLKEFEINLESCQQQVLKIIGQGTGIVLPFTPLRYT